MTNRSVPFVRDLIRGRPFYFSGGAYSDYNVHGFFIPLENIPATVLLQLSEEFAAKMKKIDEKEGWIDGDVREMFIGDLIRRGLLIEVTTPEVYLGDSSMSGPEIVFEKDKKRELE